jgi:hypothetical protein
MDRSITILGPIWFKRGEMRDFNEGERRGGEIFNYLYMFGLKEVRGGRGGANKTKIIFLSL